MEMATSTDRPDLETLAAVIARSPIVVAGPALRLALLPAGFDEVDLVILGWIAAEGRRIGRAQLLN
jgi:hypothetical protein